MFEKLIVYNKCITKFKEQHGIVEGGFPFESFNDFYKLHGDIGMLGFFLQFVQKYNFRIILNGKSVVVFYKAQKIYDKPMEVDVYDLVSRMWYGIIMAMNVIDKKIL